MTTPTWLHDDDGSALAEFAISVPLLAFVSMAAMAVMAIIQAQFGIQAAAREASMVGANTSSSIDTLDRSMEAAEAVKKGKKGEEPKKGAEKAKKGKKEKAAAAE